MVNAETPRTVNIWIKWKNELHFIYLYKSHNYFDEIESNSIKKLGKSNDVKKAFNSKEIWKQPNIESENWCKKILQTSSFYFKFPRLKCEKVHC